MPNFPGVTLTLAQVLAAEQQTTLELIASVVIYPAGTVLTLSGFTTSGDGGGAQWKLNGTVGQPVSQSPAQLGDALFNDASGNQWAFVGDSANLFQLGGVSGGTVDNSLVFIAAEKSIGTIELPDNNVFRVLTTALITKNNTKLVGSGELLGGGGGFIAGSGVLEIQAVGVEIHDITVDSDDTHGRNIRVYNASNTTIKNVKGKGATQAFIHIGDNAIDTYVERCESSRGYGVFVDDPVGSSGLFTKNNKFDGGSLDGDGIEINAPTNGFARFKSTDDNLSNYVGVSVNKGLGIALAHCSDFTIANPSILNCESDGLHFEGCSNGVSLGGVIDNTNTGGGSGGLLITDSDDLTIIGTVIENVQTKNGVAVVFTNAILSKRIKLLGINVKSVASSGFVVAGTEDCIISNCTVNDANISAGAHHGIFVTQNNFNLSIKNNTITDGASSTVAFAININDDGWTGGSLVGNNTSGCVNNEIKRIGSNSIFSSRGNIKSSVDELTGQFTLVISTTQTPVLNGNATIVEENVTIFPLSQSAAEMSFAYVNASFLANFSVTHSTALGTEVFGFRIDG